MSLAVANVMTVLEAHVDAGSWETLTEAYQVVVGELSSGIVETFLLQDSADRTLWRIATVWESRWVLEDYDSSVETPGGVVLFRDVGVEPVLSIFAVAAHAEERRHARRG